MTRWLLVAFASLLLAGVVHITVVLLVPVLAPRDLQAKAATLGPMYTMHLLPGGEAQNDPIKSTDPHMVIGICRLSLVDNPVRISADFGEADWTLSIYDRQGLSFFSLNNRASTTPAVDVVVVDIDQRNTLRQTPFPDQESMILIQSPVLDSFAVIRVLARTSNDRAILEAAMRSADCQQTPLPEPEIEPTGPQVPPSRPEE